MFELSKEIKKWKNSFRQKCSGSDIEELEDHLLELFEDLRGTGLSDHEAFSQAVSQMGNSKEVGQEFAKVKSMGEWLLDSFRALDPALFLSLVLICGMGVWVTYTAGDNISPGVWIKQTVWVVLGFCLMLLVAQVNPTRIERSTPYLYGASVLLQALLPFAGIEVLGVKKWLALGVLNIQPSVLMLLTVPMMIAWVESNEKWAQTRTGDVLILSAVLVPALVILLQPDGGMALLCILAGFSTVLLSSCRGRIVRLICLSVPMVCIAGWLIVQPNTLQNLGIETIDLRDHADFILATIAYQFGTPGVMLALASFGFLFYRAFTICKRSVDPFSRNLGLGFVGVILMQLLLNVSAMNGWVPYIRVPLPLISYGGSSLVMLLVGFGILYSIQRQQQPKY